MTDATTTMANQANRQMEQMREGLRAQSEAFWNFQDQVLNQMEEMSRAWFQRRHEATKAAVKTASAMCTTTSPADAMREYAGWASDSVGRMTRDMLDSQAHVATLSQLTLRATPQLMGRPAEAMAAAVQTVTQAAVQTVTQAAVQTVTQDERAERRKAA